MRADRNRQLLVGNISKINDWNEPKVLTSTPYHDLVDLIFEWLLQQGRKSFFYNGGIRLHGRPGVPPVTLTPLKVSSIYGNFN